jgi:hypothetical protein
MITALNEGVVLVKVNGDRLGGARDISSLLVI